MICAIQESSLHTGLGLIERCHLSYVFLAPGIFAACIPFGIGLREFCSRKCAKPAQRLLTLARKEVYPFTKDGELLKTSNCSVRRFWGLRLEVTTFQYRK